MELDTQDAECSGGLTCGLPRMLTDNISEGDLVYVSDGSEDGTKGLTENGIEELQSLLADIRTWDGGIREFLIETQCDPEIIDRIMVDEMKRGL